MRIKNKTFRSCSNVIHFYHLFSSQKNLIRPPDFSGSLIRLFSLNEDINNNLSSGTIQSRLTGYDGSASIFRRGNTVIMTYDLGYNARPMTDGIKQIFSIPEGLRPSASLITTQIVSGDNQYIWRFEENGSVTLQSLSDVSGENIWMVGYFMWTTDD